MTGTIPKSLAVFLALAATGSLHAPVAWSGESIRMAQVELDIRPSTELSDQELRARFKALRDLSKQTDKKGKAEVRALLKSDRQELMRRKKEAQASDKPTQKKKQASDKPTQKKKQQPAAAESAQQEAVQPQTAEPEKPKKAKLVDEQGSNAPLDAILSDQRAAAEMSDADLRQRMRSALKIAKDKNTSKDRRKALLAKRKADAAELNSRIAASTGVKMQTDKLPDEVAKITEDNRPAAELDDNALRQRIKLTRGLLATEGLDDATSKELGVVLAQDRREIRRRVSVQNAKKAQPATAKALESGKSNDLPGGNTGSLTIAELNSDNRPAQDLTTSALQRRIDANRAALAGDNVSADDRAGIQARLKVDRAGLRRRLSERRSRRKKDGFSTGEKIAIAAGIGLVAGAVIASRPTIAVAEAYDDELETWLVAPPLVKVQPRYRIEDFRTQPRLRYAVPGIDIDTVRFGFGEGFLREEEVPKLERIGEIVERIIAGNPNETFMIEGHTDAVGSPEANQSLSVERANAVRDALIEFFSIEDRNLAVVGYGESYLKIPTQAPEVENRRVTLRRITPLLQKSSLQ